jgi:DNA repair protein RecN (Recombination protein N)
MLSRLKIQNYALIQKLEMSPVAGLSVITGETGAGKSIILGALGLLLGQRADTKVLYDPEQRCVVEAEFNLDQLALKGFFEEHDLEYEEHCIIRREISPAAKSRAFVNDSPVSLEILKELSVQLLDVHSQQDTRLLANASYQIQVIDDYAQLHALKAAYVLAFKKYKKAELSLAELSENASAYQKDLEYNKYLLEELSSAKLQKIDQKTLEEEVQILENADFLKSKLQLSLSALSQTDLSADFLLTEALSQLNALSAYSEHYAQLRERLHSLKIELHDIVSDLESAESKIENDPNKLGEYSDTLNALYKLQKKHGLSSTEELLELEENLKTKVAAVENLDGLLEQKKIEAEKAKKEAWALGLELREARLKTKIELEQNIQSLLSHLAMPEALFSIAFEEKNMYAEGIDAVQFRFSANKGIASKALKEVASGGEFSRLMLAIKYTLSQKSKLPLIIFDEIDTGISGEVAVKVGKVIERLASKMQVWVITHLHQIASKGQSHYQVYKDHSAAKTVSKLKKLTEAERIQSIAEMIGGSSPSEAALNSAKELLMIS